jgi:hypothetical protein
VPRRRFLPLRPSLEEAQPSPPSPARRSLHFLLWSRQRENRILRSWRLGPLVLLRPPSPMGVHWLDRAPPAIWAQRIVVIQPNTAHVVCWQTCGLSIWARGEFQHVGLPSIFLQIAIACVGSQHCAVSHHDAGPPLLHAQLPGLPES